MSPFLHNKFEASLDCMGNSRRKAGGVAESIRAFAAHGCRPKFGDPELG